MNNFTLEEYKIQRQFRQKKRKEYLNRFECLKSQIGLKPSQSSHHTHNRQKLLQNKQSNQSKPCYQINQITKKKKIESGNSEVQKLEQQNQILKSKLIQIDKSEKQKLEKFKSQIHHAKQHYITQIKEINELGNTQKTQTGLKIRKLQQQIKSTSQKNQQISQFNDKVENQCNKAQQIMQKYSNSIQQQYDQKLEQFNKIFEASSEKIEQMENQYHDEQFVDATLQNQELVQSIKQNAEKADQDLDNMIKDYEQLLKGKQQIRVQLNENNKMKEDQITKMASLQQKLKIIFEKMNEQKKIYIQENSRMASQLMEVKELLTKTMGA